MVAYETNRSYCHSIGDHSQKSWQEADEWQHESAIKGVEFRFLNPGSGPSAQHEAWLRDKEASGWKYGPVKDAEKREHPCMVPYQELPFEQRLKDRLFQAVVDVFLQCDH